MPAVRPRAPELSLHAELFLVAIDPDTGRLVKRRRRRFRTALARSAGRTGPGGAAKARREAISELRRDGLIERSLLPGRYPIVPGSGASAPLARLRRALGGGEFQRPRDLRLFVLSAWTGVLAQRLTRSERRSAARRLKTLLALPSAHSSELEPIPPFARALGEVAYREEVDILWDIVGDVISGDSVSIDLGAGESGGGFDGGGTDGH